MTPIPTVIRIPESTAAGIFEATGPRASKINSSSSPAIIPESFVFPPALMFTTVRMVAPAPGIPPKTAATLLPIPWPISSLPELCLVFVILSATILVSSESMAPNKARANAVSMYGLKLLKLKDLNISS